MEATFTNPFEIVSNSVVFGLDTIKHLQQNSPLRKKRNASGVESTKVKIPKYNNYMRKVNIDARSFFHAEYFMLNFQFYNN